MLFIKFSVSLHKIIFMSNVILSVGSVGILSMDNVEFFELLIQSIGIFPSALAGWDKI